MRSKREDEPLPPTPPSYESEGGGWGEDLCETGGKVEGKVGVARSLTGDGWVGQRSASCRVRVRVVGSGVCLR